MADLVLDTCIVLLRWDYVDPEEEYLNFNVAVIHPNGGSGQLSIPLTREDMVRIRTGIDSEIQRLDAHQAAKVTGAILRKPLMKPKNPSKLTLVPKE